MLRKLARQRIWTGHPSTTQLLNGTRSAWLEVTRKYFFRPESKVFAFLGTAAHGNVERFVKEGEKAEERITDDICSGQYDFYDDQSQTLYDYKTWGSYKVAKALGMTVKFVPKKDRFGKIIYKWNTKEKRNKPEWDRVYVPGNIAEKVVGMLDTVVQLSDYRDKLQSVLKDGYKVKRIAVQIIMKDAGTQVARDRGITGNTFIIPLNGVSSHWIKKYLGRKRELLLQAIEKDYSPKCRRSDIWGGLKCKKYCDVSKICEGIGD